MANNREGNHLSYKQGADLSAKQYYIVKLSSGKVVLASAAADKIVGVLDSKPVSSSTEEVVDVRARNANGTGKVVAGGNVSVGDYLTSDGSGKAIATTTGGHEVFGMALEAGVDTQVIEYLACNSRY
jgi:hypothetical protein